MERRVTVDLDAILAGLRALDERHRYHKIDYFEPYEKQEQFFALGVEKRERLLMAGNQLGKTYAGAAEVAFHLTGDYPWWWTGRRINHSVAGWAAGEATRFGRLARRLWDDVLARERLS